MEEEVLRYLIDIHGADKAAREFEKISKAGEAAMKRVAKNAELFYRLSGETKKSTAAIQENATVTDQNTQARNRNNKAHSNWFAHIAKTTVMSAAVNKSFLTLTESLGQATKQLDLIENFPSTMAALGVSATDASAGMERLRDYVNSIGGNLTDATNAVSRFTSVNKNVKASVAMYAGINNALIAGAASAESQRAALEQLVQGYSRGRFEGEEWRSMQTAMNLAMTETARVLGQDSTVGLRDSLAAGEISINEFMATMAQVSTGTGPVAQAAIANMQGVGFATAVLRNTLVNGLTAIYQAIGRQNIVAFFSLVTGIIQVLAGWVATLIGLFIQLFNFISGIFGGPQISVAVGETAAVANNLQGGADAANGLKDGIDGAGKSAKKLSKQLASFDKMNVLADKDSGGDSGGGGGGGGGGGSPAAFNPGDLANLDDIFGNLGKKLQEASMWAKVLAGILAGLAANGLISKIFGVNPLKEFVKALMHPKKALEDLRKAAKTTMDDINKAYSKGFQKGADTKAAGAKMGKGLADGITSGIGGAIGGISTKLVPALARLGPALLRAIPIVGIVSVVVTALWLIYDNWDLIVKKVKEIWAPIGDFFTGVWQRAVDVFTAIGTPIMEFFIGVWNWIQGTWSSIVEALSGPFQVAMQIIRGIFILLVALVAITLETIYNVLKGIGSWIWNNVIKPVGEFFKDLWNGVVNGVIAMWNGMMTVLRVVGTWIFDNIITPVLNFFKALWDGIVNLAKLWWQGIKAIMAPIVSWISVTVITPVSNFFKGLWDGIKNMVSGFVSAFKNYFSPIANWIKSNVIDRVANFFTGLWNGIKRGVEGIVGSIKSVMSNIANVIKAPINAIIDGINGVIDGINQIKVPDWVPEIGGQSPNFPRVPRLARGGIIDQATLAVVGEAGSEAVVPLENNTEGLDRLASMLNSRMGSSQPVQIVLQVGEEQIVDKFVDLINDKSYMSGRNVIYV